MQSAEYYKTYYLKNREKIRAAHAAYYQRHKEEWNTRYKSNLERHRLRAKRWANENRIGINQKAANRRAEEKEVVMNMYSNGDACCRWCGHADMDVLQLDHIDDNGAGNRKGRDFYRWLIKHDYPSGFQVLCANCNTKKQICRVQGRAISSVAGGGAHGAF